MEKWLEIPGLNGKYLISNHGRIYSFFNNSILVPYTRKSGYLFANLRKNNKKYSNTVHRLVMLTFKGYSNLQITHLDGVRSNNKLENLKYGRKSHRRRIDPKPPKNRTYKTWVCMRQRCNNVRNVSYKRYGLAGITCCERWGSFENFLSDMGERPDGKTLDRIDNSLGYFKENCRWATPLEQASNRGPIKLDWARLLTIATLKNKKPSIFKDFNVTRSHSCSMINKWNSDDLTSLNLLKAEGRSIFKELSNQ